MEKQGLHQPRLTVYILMMSGFCSCVKAAVLRNVLDVSVEEVETPEPEPNEILVRVMACGICPVDVRVYTGENLWVSLPSIGVSGHEVAGVVEKIGERVATHRPGDRVAGSLAKPCGFCRYCVRGRENLCSNLTLNKPKVYGFSQYVVASPLQMPRFSAAIDFEEAAFTEPLSACVNAVERSNLDVGDWALVVGVGQIGLMQTQLLKRAGARVLAVDFIEERLKLAEKLGAEVVFDAGEPNVVDKIRRATDGEGVDFASVTVGSEDAFQLAFESLAKTGVLNIFASFAKDPVLRFNPNTIHYREASITGTYSGSKRNIHTALQLLEKRMIDVRPLITHRFPLEQIVEGFHVHKQKKGIKAIIFP